MIRLVHSLILVSIFIFSSASASAVCKSVKDIGREKERRVVLIGNWKYAKLKNDLIVDADADRDQFVAWTSLTGPKADVQMFQKLLSKDDFDFKVEVHRNLKREQMVTLFDNLEATVACEDDLVIMYSGHGTMIEDKTYFVPVDAVAYSSEQAESSSERKRILQKNRARNVSVSKYLNRLRSVKNSGGRLLFFDACRDKLTKSSPLGDKGVTLDKALPFVAIYASGEGQKAKDGGKCGGSVFSCAFHSVLETNCSDHSADLTSAAAALIEGGTAHQRPHFSNRGNKNVRFCPVKTGAGTGAGHRVATCESGKSITQDTQGHCCWPGQSWSSSRSKCLGTPTSCPEGLVTIADSCSLPACETGKIRTQDTRGHCCWSGQSWSSSQNMCVGIPTSCPGDLKPNAYNQTCEEFEEIVDDEEIDDEEWITDISPPPSTLPSGTVMLGCGCHGFLNSPYAREDRCSSGQVTIRSCGAPCPLGGYSYLWVCR